MLMTVIQGNPVVKTTLRRQARPRGCTHGFSTSKVNELNVFFLKTYLISLSVQSAYMQKKSYKLICKLSVNSRVNSRNVSLNGYFDCVKKLRQSGSFCDRRELNFIETQWNIKISITDICIVS